MTVLTEGQYRGEFMISEAEGFRSREQWLLVAPTAPMEAGTVIMAGPGVQPAMAPGTACILWDNVEAPVPPLPDPPGDIEVTVIVRDAEVNGHDLIWPAPGDPAAIAAATAALAAAGIIVR